MLTWFRAEKHRARKRQVRRELFLVTGCSIHLSELPVMAGGEGLKSELGDDGWRRTA